ncbi:hypothetical protein BH11BAC2_BH11BAC2_11810 [soil metagenome]
MEESIGTYVKDLKNEVSSYVDLKLEYTKLVTYEKIAKVSAASVSILLIGLFAFFAFFFLSFAAGFYIGQITGSDALGFGIITIVYILLLFIVIAIRKKYMEAAIVEKVIEALMEDDNERQSNEQSDPTAN